LTGSQDPSKLELPLQERIYPEARGFCEWTEQLECGMKAAASGCFSMAAAARLGVLLCSLLIPCVVVSGAQSTPPSPPQQAPAAQPTPEITTTQQPSPTPPAKASASADATSEIDEHPSVPFESHVNLVPVRVVVHDSNGKAVTNLSKEDFRLFQDGRPQTISLFTVETPTSTEKQVVRGAPGGETADQPKVSVAGTLILPTRFVALLFDDVHLNMQDLVQARLAAMRYLDSSIDPSERVAIFTTSGQTQVEFTDDRAKIRAVAAQLMPHFIGAYDPSDNTQCPKIGYYQADLIINQNDQGALDVAKGEAALCIASSGMVANEDPTVLVQRTAQQTALAGDTNAEYAIRRLVEVVRRMSALPGQRSIVLVSPGFLITTSHQFDLSDVIDRATRANIFINTLDARGLYTAGETEDLSCPPQTCTTAHFGHGATSYRYQEQASQSDVMAQLSGSLKIRRQVSPDKGDTRHQRQIHHPGSTRFFRA
jgi:VWFA-related protein